MDRRQFLVAGTLSAGYVLTPAPCRALAPFVANLLITIAPPMIGAIASLIESYRQRKFSRQLNFFEQRLKERQYFDQQQHARFQYVKDWLSFGVQSGSISYSVATDAVRKSLLSMELSSDLDGDGTIANVENGVLSLQRGGYGGHMHASAIELAAFSKIEKGRVPVWVDGARQLDKSEVTDAISRIEAATSRDGSEINREFSLHSVVPYSHARRPTKSGADQNLYALFARRQIEQNRANVQGQVQLDAVFLPG